MPDGELNVTLGTLSLSSDAEPSGDIVRAVLANISLSSEGRVLLYGALATTLDSVTSAASGGVEITGALAATLGGVSAETFGASLNGTTAPYEDILSWTGHPATGSLVRVRTGNLVGIFGEPNEFGLFAGEGWDPSSGAVPLASSQYIRLGSITNEFHNVPINLYDDGDITMQMEPDAPSFAMGNPIPSGYETGAGLWQGKDTDDIYKWRVGDPSVGGSMLSWNGGSLSLVNSSLDISGATAHIAFGDPPPTSPTSGTGIWIDKTGLYGINAGVTQIFIDTLDGILYVDGGTELGVNPLLGNLYIDGLLTLGTDGRMQQGTGTWGTDFTGSAIWNDSGIMNIGGWNNNVKQWWGGSDGKLKAGGGDIVLGENGIILNALSGSDAYDSKKSLNFMMMDTNTLVGYLSGYKGGNEEAYANILRMWANGSSPNYRSTLKFITYNGDASNQKISIITLQSTPTNTSIVFTADSSLAIGNFNVTNGGLHVGGTSDPGTDNLVVDGTIKDGSGVAYLKSTQKAADSDKLDGLDSTDFVRDIAYKVSAYRDNTTFTLTTSGTLYAIPLNAEEFDSHSQHDNSTNPERFTCVKAGTYLVTGQVTFAANATGNRDALLRVNGTNYVGQNRYVAMASGSTSVPVFAMVKLAVDDYVELIGRQYSGGSLNLYYANSLSNHMKVIRLSS